MKQAHERMIWASNWPHPSVPKDNVPDDAGLLDLLADWTPDEVTRRKILVDDPAELYGLASYVVLRTLLPQLVKLSYLPGRHCPG